MSTPPSHPPPNTATRLFVATYAGLILFGSLYPFSGWLPWQAWSWDYLVSPLPKFITRTDLTTNLLVYAPLGYALALLPSRSTPRRRIILLATLVCTGYSLLLESAQVLLPTRNASNIDVATNALGALLGGLFARQHLRWLRVGLGVRRWRGAWFQPGRAVNAGLILLALWYLAQFSLMPFPGMGWLALYLRPIESGMALAKLNWPWFGAVFLEMAALGSVALLLLRPSRRVRGLSLLFITAFLAKVLMAILLLRLKALGGVLSLETALAFVGAYWLLRLPSVQWRRFQLALPLLGGIVVLRLAVAKYALIPHSSPFNIVGLADLTASLWPYLGLMLLMALAIEKDRPSPAPARF